MAAKMTLRNEEYEVRAGMTVRDALKKIGISPSERKEWNITFHSWRHFFNTLLRGKIHDAKLRALTGHRTLEMTEHYTKFRLEDFTDVVKVQNEFLS